MADLVLVDVEGAVRDWLRTLPAVTGLVASDRIEVGRSEGDAPMVAILRVAGEPNLSEAPLDLPWLQVDVWGSQDPEALSRSATIAIASQVASAFQDLRGVAVGSVYLYTADVLGAPFVPDPVTNRPRYSLTVALQARSN